jgi:hypothetical protein
MLKRLARSIVQNSPFQNEWGLQSGSTSYIDKRIIVGYNIIKDSMAFTLNIQKAKFLMRDSYFSVKNKGYATVEFTPFIDNPQDPTRKTFSNKDKRSMVLYPDSIHSILTTKSLKVEYRREREGEICSLDVSEKNEHWEWALQVTGNRTDHRKMLLSQVDQFYILRLLDYSIPYIFGWYALGDSRLAEQSLSAEPEGKDPFENI